MKIAKDDLILKQTMVKQLTEATVGSNKAFEKLSASIDNVGKSIGDGLKLLANAIGNNNNNQQPYDPRTPGFHHVADSRAQAFFNQQNILCITMDKVFPLATTLISRTPKLTKIAPKNNMNLYNQILLLRFSISYIF